MSNLQTGRLSYLFRLRQAVDTQKPVSRRHSSTGSRGNGRVMPVSMSCSHSCAASRCRLRLKNSDDGAGRHRNRCRKPPFVS